MHVMFDMRNNIVIIVTRHTKVVTLVTEIRPIFPTFLVNFYHQLILYERFETNEGYEDEKD